MKYLSLKHLTLQHLAFLLLFLLTACGVTAQNADSRITGLEVELERLQSERAILEIPECFALAMDTLGASPAGGQAEAKAIMQECYTDDASIKAYIIGNPDPILVADNLDTFISQIRASFDRSAYVITLHLMGNKKLSFMEDDTAKLLSRSITPHFVNGTGTERDGTVDLVPGRFEDEVVLVDGVWKSQKKTIYIDAFWITKGTVVALPSGGN